MNRTGTSNVGQRPGDPDGDAGRRLPEVTARERDFWRRAVALERERLDLELVTEGAAPRGDAH